ncbi:C6 transcription factor [Paraphaeosphaeria sporulosa]
MSRPILPTPGSIHLPKVPIRRLDKQARNTTRSAAVRHRIISRASRACLGCRKRKTRCDGGQPRCSNCWDKEEPCIYEPSRRNRLKTSAPFANQRRSDC